MAELLISVGADINNTASKGVTALMAASESGHSEVVTMLLKQENINVDQVDDEGRTALFFAAGIRLLDELIENSVCTSSNFIFRVLCSNVTNHLRICNVFDV